MQMKGVLLLSGENPAHWAPSPPTMKFISILVIVALVSVLQAFRVPINPSNYKTDQPDDYCFPYKTCEECLKQLYCGWCSTPVVGGDGAQCAGFSPDNKSTPFICIGQYQTTTCVFPTTGTTQGSSTSSGGTGSSGTGTGSSTSTSTTGYSPVSPVSGTWRGIQINDGYIRGEWNFTFAGDAVTVYGPTNQYFTGSVVSTATELAITISSGDYVGFTLYGIYETDFGPASLFFTLAVAPAGGKVPPPNWGAAMKDRSSQVWTLVQPKEF